MPGLFDELNKKNGQSTPAPQPTGSGGLFNQINSGPSQPAKSSMLPELPENPFDTTLLDRSIENAKMRIEDAGGNVNPDNRNWFEKFTNLPEGQNALFDTFEIIGRPQQAMYQWLQGKLDKKPGRQIDKDTIAGFKGTAERVTGSKLLNKYAGIENKYGRGIGGFAIDVVADPINLIPGGAIVKLGKGVGKGLGFGAKALDKATDLIPGVRNFKDTKLIPAADATKDAFGNIFKFQHNWDKTLTGGTDDTLKNTFNQTQNDIKYMTENMLRTVSTAAREAGGVKQGDAIGRIMEKDLRQFEDVKGYEFPDGVRRTENKQDLIDVIRANKEQLKELGKGVNATKKEYQNAIGEFANGLSKTDEEIRKLYMGLERQAGKLVSKETKANIRQASREAVRLESQINNFGKNEASLLKHYKQLIKANHEESFALIKSIRQTAPNGIKGVTKASLPPSLHNFLREGGKGIDEVASELGFRYADDLVKELNKLKDTPRKLDDATVERLAREEMERSGAIKYLSDTKSQLESGLNTIKSSIKEIGKNAPKLNNARAAEKAFADIANDPRYKELMEQRTVLKGQLDELRGSSKQARAAKINEIRAVESSIDSLRESLRNPVVMQKEFQRPLRYVEHDSNGVAAKLMESNKTIRDWATSNNIPVGELEGYMAHIRSAEEKAFKKAQKGKQLDRGSGGMSNPDKGILKGRQLLGSAEDINERVGRKLFETNAFFATAAGQKKLIDYGNAVKFRKEILSNPNFAKPYKDGDPTDGFEVIHLNNYSFTKPGEEGLETLGGKFLVTKGVKSALDRFQHISTDEGIRKFLKIYDTGLGWWKRLALLSGGYHLRNVIGAQFNNYVAGMDTPDLVKYTTLAAKDIKNALRGKESTLYDAYRREGLSSTSQNAIEFAKFADDPEKAITQAVKRESRTLGQKTVGLLNPLKAPENSQAIGNFADQINRFALFKWAVEKKGMTPQQAAAKVRETQFDYSRNTNTEREFFTRLVPFYRWSRNNIPFQLQKFAEDPARYSRVDKLRRNFQDSFGLEEQDTPDYMKQNFFMPVTSNGDGTGKMLGANLPVGDLTRLSNPGKLGLDSLTPLLKTPIELVSNRNLFFNNDIKRFEGQEKKYQVPDSIYGFDIPGGGKELGGLPVQLAYALEQAGGQPARALSNMFGKPTQQEEENKALKPSLGISSLLKKYDINETNYRAKQKELRELMDLIDYLEQENGERPRSVTDIKKGR